MCDVASCSIPRDGSIFTYTYDLAEEGSSLTPEFVAFLKDAD